MLYNIFQQAWEPDLIHRILIGFEAIIEKILNLIGRQKDKDSSVGLKS